MAAYFPTVKYTINIIQHLEHFITIKNLVSHMSSGNGLWNQTWVQTLDQLLTYVISFQFLISLSA